MSYIILDRDGVINFDSDEYIKSPQEWRAIPGSLAAIARLHQSGFKIIIATNQSGVARGLYDLPMLDRIHEKMHAEVNLAGGAIHDIFICPHHPEDNCFCRKPKPGLLYAIQSKYQIALNETFFIGDSMRDMLAAEASGCIPLLVLTGNGVVAMRKLKNPTIKSFQDLSKAADYVIHHKRK